jgi:ferredoxin
VITKKLKNNKDILHLPAPLIPGNLPYRAYQEKATTIVPETDYMLCTFCKTCMDVCPVNAISVDDMVITDGELCTLCCACVKYCPDNARKLNHPAINATRDKLFLNFSTRKEATFFV